MMQNSFKISLIILLLTILFACKQDQKEIDIFYPQFNKLNKKCRKEFEGSFIFDKLQISNYYYIENKIGIKIDKNSICDSVALVVPKQFNMFKYNTKCNINEIDDNLLVISMNHSKNFVVYNKIISNGSMLNGQESIFKSKTGFIIQGDWGHSNKIFTKIYANIYQKKLYIDSINIESWGLKQYHKTLEFKNKVLPLSKYKRTDMDSIKNILDSQKNKNKYLKH